jgi:hypothetical protein
MFDLDRSDCDPFADNFQSIRCSQAIVLNAERDKLIRACSLTGEKFYSEAEFLTRVHHVSLPQMIWIGRKGGDIHK